MTIFGDISGWWVVVAPKVIPAKGLLMIKAEILSPLHGCCALDGGIAYSGEDDRASGSVIDTSYSAICNGMISCAKALDSNTR
ncbi:MAG: hypothetical protein BJG00_014335 [Limnothrix sp. CACIAM 69d]|nr:MAG: hypothetical protein BJG00_014335 [Limnothrix sp. CACIAM 69d]